MLRYLGSCTVAIQKKLLFITSSQGVRLALYRLLPYKLGHKTILESAACATAQTSLLYFPGICFDL